jgi:hypothetical protein
MPVVRQLAASIVGLHREDEHPSPLQHGVSDEQTSPLLAQGPVANS